MSALARKRLGRIERQLLLEAAPAGSDPGTVILPPLHQSDPSKRIPRQASNRAVRTLQGSGLIAVGRAHRMADVMRYLRPLFLHDHRPEWLPQTADARVRFLAVALTMDGQIHWLRADQYNKLAKEDPSRRGDVREEVRSALRAVRPHLQIRFMRRTALGEAVVAKYRPKLESALTPGPLDRIRWDHVTLR